MTMIRPANFYIEQVRKDAKGNLISAKCNVVVGKEFRRGVILSVKDIISLIADGEVFRVIYQDPKNKEKVFEVGGIIKPHPESNPITIKAESKTEFENLNNLPIF